MRYPKRITAAWLERHGACDREIERFREAFPIGAEVTRANLQHAAMMGFDLMWPAQEVLSSSAFRRIEKAVGPAREILGSEDAKIALAYWAAFDKACKEYDEAFNNRTPGADTSEIDATYEKALESARNRRDKKRAASQQKLDLVIAQMIADLIGLP